MTDLISFNVTLSMCMYKFKDRNKSMNNQKKNSFFEKNINQVKRKRKILKKKRKKEQKEKKNLNKVPRKEKNGEKIKKLKIKRKKRTFFWLC